MKFSKSVVKGIGGTALAGLLVCGMSVTLVAAQGEAEVKDGEKGMISMEVAPTNYSSLPSLVAMISRDAMEQFYDFFGPEPVLVEPFMVLGEYPAAKVSLLGATLADQMTAVINNEAIAQPHSATEVYEQRLQGLLQESDGYLRIHMSGQNSRGEWRSYVVNVEMSEPIYRALHSYVAM